MPITTQLTRQLDISTPIIQAPMAGVAGGKLAAAVSAAGGFGFVAAGYLPADQVLEQLALAGQAKFGVGFITWRVMEDPSIFEAVLARKPAAIFLSFGDAAALIPRIRKAGAMLFMQVQSLDGAKDAARLGADFIIIQGSAAGGHGAQRALGPMLDEVLAHDLGPIVIAAGGISHGRALAAQLVRGASGGLIGTALYNAEESMAHPAAKQRAIATNGDDTQRSDLFDAARQLNWPDGWTLRTVKNRFLQQWQNGANFAHATAAERAGFASAVAAGDFDIAPVIIGEGAGLIRQVEPAAQIISRMDREAEAALKDAAQLIG